MNRLRVPSSGGEALYDSLCLRDQRTARSSRSAALPCARGLLLAAVARPLPQPVRDHRYALTAARHRLGRAPSRSRAISGDSRGRSGRCVLGRRRPVMRTASASRLWNFVGRRLCDEVGGVTLTVSMPVSRRYAARGLSQVQTGCGRRIGLAPPQLVHLPHVASPASSGVGVAVSRLTARRTSGCAAVHPPPPHRLLIARIHCKYSHVAAPSSPSA